MKTIINGSEKMINLWKFFKIYVSLIASAIMILLVLLAVILLLGYIFHLEENIKLGKALYFSFITVLTIGYGDITPHTIIGKIISILLGIIGVVFIGIMTAAAIKSLEKASLKKGDN